MFFTKNEDPNFKSVKVHYIEIIMLVSYTSRINATTSMIEFTFVETIALYFSKITVAN